MEAWEQIEGAKEFVTWFGRWPGFHDSELRHLHLNVHGESSLLIYTFEMTNEIDEAGYYKLTKHALVEIRMSNIQQLQIEGEFDCGVVLFGLAVAPVIQAGKLIWIQVLELAAG